MAFLEDLGKKLTEAGQSAAKIGKEKSDLAKLNSFIADEEKNINVKYFLIGKLCVAKYSEAPSEEFVPMYSSINESRKKIVMYREQIQRIKGIRKCKNCGADLAKDVAYCSSCGAFVGNETQSQNNDSTVCSNCGQTVEKGTRFCTACGFNLQTSGASAVQPQNTVQEPITQQIPDNVVVPAVEPAVPTAGVVPVVEPEIPEVETATKEVEAPATEPAIPEAEPTVSATEPGECPICGTKAAEGELFCTNCGYKLK